MDRSWFLYHFFSHDDLSNNETNCMAFCWIPFTQRGNCELLGSVSEYIATENYHCHFSGGRIEGFWNHISLDFVKHLEWE